MIKTLVPLEGYAQRFTAAEPPVLRRLRLETYRTRAYPQMISGPLQGRLLYLLARISGARRVLEIGTFVGYSALCFAEALPPGGEVLTLDRDPTVRAITRKHFSAVPYGRKIRLLTGEALSLLPKLRAPFDLAFIDADKIRYACYYDAVFPKVRRGGLIVADNLFWSGSVLDRRAKDPETRALRAFAAKVRRDPRVEPVLLTVRDGLLVARKR